MIKILAILLFAIPLNAQIRVAGFGNKAIDSAFSIAHATNQKVIFPKGDYYVANVKLLSGLTIEGETGAVIHKIFQSDYAIGCNFDDISDPIGISNVRNISVSGLSFAGTSTTDGFYEFRHLLCLNGVDNVSITNCNFTAFNGDGIYIGAGLSAEKYNTNITIVNCKFNGINYQNRNAISVITINGMIIEGCDFSNCSSNVMPGAIDFEPDNFPYYGIQNISVHDNTFFNIGGSLGVICSYTPILAKPPIGIHIFNNKISNSKNRGVYVGYMGAGASYVSGILIENNTLDNLSKATVLSEGINDVIIRNNLPTVVKPQTGFFSKILKAIAKLFGFS